VKRCQCDFASEPRYISAITIADRKRRALAPRLWMRSFSPPQTKNASGERAAQPAAVRPLRPFGGRGGLSSSLASRDERTTLSVGIGVELGPQVLLQLVTQAHEKFSMMPLWTTAQGASVA